MKIISLSSGGLDSSVLLCMLKKEKHDVHPLFINYGQKSAKYEKNAFDEVCNYLKIDGHTINLDSLKEIRCGLTDDNISAMDFPYFPARNLILASIGASYAYNHASNIISLGFLQGSVFFDQSQTFVGKLEDIVQKALETDFKVLVPFIDMNKQEVFQLAQEYDFPIDITYSCHTGTKTPCGKCMGCVERHKVIN